MENNTISGFHIRSKKGDPLQLYPKKYTWHIPKYLRELNIQPGDIVAVGKANNQPFLVSEVFRKELENTGKRYKRVRAIFERVPVKI